MLTCTILLTKFPLKELDGESNIEANIEKKRFTELFDHIAVETFGLKNSDIVFAAASGLTKLPIQIRKLIE